MIHKLIGKNRDYVIQLRRYFHQHPEPSWNEFETSKYVKAELTKMGVPFISIAKTGVIATIEGNKPGKTVALRADMDALEILEENTTEYVSKNPGIMHACGHDGHTAMMLGTAKALSELKDYINGTVKLFFQPAEEMVQGAKLMIEEGALENVDGIMGIHLWSGIETGKISCEAGPRMASGDYVIVDIKGRGGHGSMPNQGVDAVLVAAAFITNMQMMVSREINPLDPAVLTFGEVKSGTRFNILSGSAHLEGTSRCFDPEIQKRFPEIIKRYGENIAKAYRAEFSLNYIIGTPPTINEPQCSEIAKNSVIDFLGSDGLISYEKTTGSEDMAYYLERVPGLIAFVGARNDEKKANYPHHHPKFNIDEDSLEIGTELYVRFAIDFLNKFKAL
ncbi:MAG: amidohydrolase [Clostridiales bacterium]|nr:amidohydrolase [Clostridiales bacterium]